MNRYFYLYNKDKIVALFKAIIDDDAETYEEFQWTPEGWVVNESGRVLAFLMNGADDMVEISSEEVRHEVPAALK